MKKRKSKPVPRELIIKKSIDYQRWYALLTPEELKSWKGEWIRNNILNYAQAIVNL